MWYALKQQPPAKNVRAHKSPSTQKIYSSAVKGKRNVSRSTPTKARAKRVKNTVSAHSGTSRVSREICANKAKNEQRTVTRWASLPLSFSRVNCCMRTNKTNSVPLTRKNNSSGGLRRVRHRKQDRTRRLRIQTATAWWPEKREFAQPVRQRTSSAPCLFPSLQVFSPRVLFLGGTSPKNCSNVVCAFVPLKCSGFRCRADVADPVALYLTKSQNRSFTRAVPRAPYEAVEPRTCRSGKTILSLTASETPLANADVCMGENLATNTLRFSLVRRIVHILTCMDNVCGVWCPADAAVDGSLRFFLPRS